MRSHRQIRGRLSSAREWFSAPNHPNYKCEYQYRRLRPSSFGSARRPGRLQARGLVPATSPVPLWLSRSPASFFASRAKPRRNQEMRKTGIDSDCRTELEMSQRDPFAPDDKARMAMDNFLHHSDDAVPCPQRPDARDRKKTGHAARRFYSAIQQHDRSL